ncbi:single-stranded-DNA-specific exonuclease RecJ [Candidatus Woesebacteria bacterium]|nr:single-stranded-DNA-specific exonuclease RecJ [Candidatus Woesebacteria bacterium]
MQWQLQSPIVPNSISELTNIVLKNRGVTDETLFFNPPHPATFTPESVGFDPKQFELAVKRLKLARKKHEKVLLFGDYDADGICATAVLWKTLHALDVEVVPFIPDRFEHGYGLSLAALESIFATRVPDLIVTVDNGIVAFPALEWLREQGISVLVTDHHQPEHNELGEALFPPADAIVHTTKLCGTTVSWMLAHALAPAATMQQLDLCAIATIADMVPLTHENRSFAWHGIDQLRKTTNLGVRELLKALAIDPQTITTQTIGYTIGPHINAMGRVAQGMDALRLLCAAKPVTARKQAKLLQKTNVQRQDLTSDMFAEALLQAERMADQKILVVASELFHEGVIGLVAGKLVERYHKPAIAISYTELTAKASARSVVGVNIVELIRSIREDLLELGGHPMAAGFSLAPDKITVVIERLQIAAQSVVSDVHLDPSLAVDCEIPPSLIAKELFTALSRFEPIGRENEPAVFLLKACTVLSVGLIGKDKQHVKLIVQVGELSYTALFWNGVSKGVAVSVSQVVDVVGRLELQTWNGRESIQIIVSDLKTHS